ncbi:uncharacterized protein LOC131673171 isoform X2 [Phymastichus coffea]|uniref:uncharacterized protein LOC131673171 isoform X2 n=1 Tax=Phymastichus coffea TaxID=108790 RepID=UPI00273CDAD7|nr:uncharacterized protein LOC131673171 isoform X2 [Phymastichus coffea]
MRRIHVSAALCLGLLLGLASGQSCSEDKVRKCISIAEPMLKDPHLIFPDNTNDIDSVCRTWSNFVDCIRRYIDKCFSKLRKDQFNSAVEPPIASVHQMCSVSSYQTEYLQYAGCIKSTVIEPEHCGPHYSALVNEVSQETVRKANLCCAYHNFRSCAILKTRLRCDANREEGIAARFSRQVLDKAFRFLQDQCLNYIGDAGRCASLISSSRLGEGRSVSLDSSAQSNGARLGAPRASGKPAHLDVYRAKPSDLHDSVTSPPSFGSDNLEVATASGQQQQQQQQQQRHGSGAKEGDEPPARAEASGSRKAEPSHHTPPIIDNSATPTQRSSGYGRGINWAPSSSSSSSIGTTKDIPDWATNTWLAHGQELTTEEIYPAAGSFGGNNIDEPNQQGLSRNSSPLSPSSTATLALFLHLLVAAILNARVA